MTLSPPEDVNTTRLIATRQTNPSRVQASHLNRVGASLRSRLSRYTQYLRQLRQRPLPANLQAVLKTECDRLSATLNQLEQRIIRIAVFGLVSRGKSAVLNALIGQKIFQTGPLHGVTQWPRSVCWTLPGLDETIQVELIDTPGLDEIEGQARATMARDVAQQADLILFVVSGDVTRTEYQALSELQRAQKPILMVFNKIDLYPDQDRSTLYQKLQHWFARDQHHQFHPRLIGASEIVRVAAEPAPRQVRLEWPDGRVTHEWETLPPQVDELQQAILNLLHQDGRSLLAFNTIRQAKVAEQVIAEQTLTSLQAEAETLIWKFAQYKALAVALNPIGVLDVIGGLLVDLAMIRSLSRLYGLPMTSYEAGKLWRRLLISAGGILLSELGSSILLGVGKSGAIASALSNSDFTGIALAQLSAGLTQGAIAGYLTFGVGRAAQVYLDRGCTWGADGPDTMLREVLSQIDRTSILYRLAQELGDRV